MQLQSQLPIDFNLYFSRPFATPLLVSLSCVSAFSEIVTLGYIRNSGGVSE